MSLDRAKRAKKYYERSEFRVAFAFSKTHENINQKIAPRIERKRDSIEFERSENQGQFFMIGLLIILKFLNSFRLPISLIFQ
ncbi:TPA: hypothetical protein JI285_16400 [Acinetobacter baumannii]|nr:hypothetical protein FSC02_16120 [Acinetobacter indicus]RDF67652.1 hypothetical protein DV997_17440 [Acinetobacter baumannii]TQR62764.1 hypothetical protein E2K52_08715 [Acinetobacter sp. RF14B]RDF78678.1 hypothetical protein DWA08_02605 [Acinetobacter baumannii]RVT51955.1 hypothetical protein ENC21_09405 [Acinetobacter indicus]